MPGFMLLRRIHPRRWRMQQSLAGLYPDIGKSLAITSVYLVIMLALHTAAMITFENLSIWDAIWLTLTTVTTVGYGDISASTVEGRLSTIMILFVGSIFVVAKAAGDYFDYRAIRRQKMLRGDWRWYMRDFIAILNTPSNHGEQYLARLVAQFRESRDYTDTPIQILTSAFPDGLPKTIRRYENVAHYSGRANLVENMEAISISDALVIIVLAKEQGDRASDGRSFDIIHRLRELNVRGKILVECVDDVNRQRLLGAGAEIVIRPIRAYPEMIVRAFVAPGSEQIIENLFSSAGDEYLRFEIDIEKRSWAEIVCALALNDLGTAIGYISKIDNSVQCNPPAQQKVSASALFIVVREENLPKQKLIERALMLERNAALPITQ